MKPEWQDWPEEPWLVSPMSGMVMRDVRGKTFPVLSRGPAGERLRLCVNALAGIRNPAAVKEVIRAARATLDKPSKLVWPHDNLRIALMALDQEPDQNAEGADDG